jgi:hypothetical protein
MSKPLGKAARRWWHFVALGAAGVLAACESPRVATGPATPAPPVIPPEQAMPYRLVVSGQGDALAREQVVKAVQAALAARGLRPAATGEAVLVVTLDLKVGPPHDGPVGSSEAVYEVTPGKEEYQSVMLGIGGNGGTLYDMQKVKQPDIVTYQGERPVTVIRTVYEKRLRLSARVDDGSPGGRPDREAWSVEFVTEGVTRDWRRMLPALAGPARVFLGPDLDGPTVLHLDEASGAIEAVERAL